jgi:hypothetical protein
MMCLQFCPLFLCAANSGFDSGAKSHFRKNGVPKTKKHRKTAVSVAEWFPKAFLFLPDDPFLGTSIDFTSSAIAFQ